MYMYKGGPPKKKKRENISSTNHNIKTEINKTFILKSVHA